MHKSFGISRVIEQSLLPVQARNIMLCHLAKRTIINHRPTPHHHFIVAFRYQNFRITKKIILVSPKDSALCLLKTQFAKKPKNPV